MTDAYPALSSDTTLLDQIFGKGKWRLTGGYRSQAREDELRAAGADTVPIGHVSRHSLGGEDNPGALDIEVPGMSPAEAEAVLIKANAPFGGYLAEGPHGTQGAHLHLRTTKGGAMPAVAGATPVLSQLGLGMPSPLTKKQQEEMGQDYEDVRAASDKAAMTVADEGEALKDAEKHLASYTPPTPPGVPALPDEGKMMEEELKKVSDHPNDPSRVFTQWLPMVAMLGGALAKDGALGSLKAIGASMQAAKTNDEDARKRAHELYLDKIKQITDQFDLEQKGYQDVLEAHKDDLSSQSALLGVKAAESENAKLQVMLKEGKLGDALKLIEASQKSAAELRQAFEMQMQLDRMDEDRRRDDERIREDEARDRRDNERLDRMGTADQNRLRAELTKKGTAGEAMQAAGRSLAKLRDMEAHPEAYATGPGSVIAADTFSRFYNGGMAIRSFQNKMLTENRNVWQQFHAMLQKFSINGDGTINPIPGGTYTPKEIALMAKMIRLAQPEIQADFQSAANDSLATAAANGDPNPVDVIPFGLRQYVDPAVMKQYGGGGQGEGEAPAANPDTPIPLPESPTPDTLTVGQVYESPVKGLGRWNGKSFDRVKPK
jgi:hypothetical protein